MGKIYKKKMWINIIRNQQKFCIELTGEETLFDVENILNESYNIGKNFFFFVNNKFIPEEYYSTPLGNVPGIKGFDLIEINIITENELVDETPIAPSSTKQNKYICIGESSDYNSTNKSKLIQKGTKQKKAQNIQSNKIEKTEENLQKNDKNNSNNIVNGELQTDDSLANQIQATETKENKDQINEFTTNIKEQNKLKVLPPESNIEFSSRYHINQTNNNPQHNLPLKRNILKKPHQTKQVIIAKPIPQKKKNLLNHASIPTPKGYQGIINQPINVPPRQTKPKLPKVHK